MDLPPPELFHFVRVVLSVCGSNAQLVIAFRLCIMVKLHLTASQRLRFRKTVKDCRLRLLRCRPYRYVRASNVFTGESKQVEVSCVEQLRKVIATGIPFADVRIFHENVELSDFHDIETEVTFVREPSPSKALAFLSCMDARMYKYPRQCNWSEYDITKVRETIRALCNMDLLYRQVISILHMARHWDEYREIPNYIMSDIGTIIGRACVDFELGITFILPQIRRLRVCCRVPKWLLGALTEIVAQQRGIVAPYVATIIKDMAAYIQSTLAVFAAELTIYATYGVSPSLRRLTEFDKLADAIFRAEQLVPIEHVIRMQFVLLPLCPDRHAILKVLCHITTK